MDTPAFFADPHQEYARMRDEAAVHRVREASGPGYWLVTRYAEARAALADPRLSWDPSPEPADSPDPADTERPADIERAADIARPAYIDRAADIARPADQGADQAAGLRERAGALLDGLAARGGGDLIADFARPLSATPVGANLIGNGMVTLLRHPAQRAALRARPDLLPGAVEELVRYDGPIARSAPARAREELTVGGVTIPAGGVVVAGLASANRDPRRFTDPDRLDLTRDGDGHLGFGHGRHRSPAAAAARVVGQVAIGALLERFPRLALAVRPDELRWIAHPRWRGVSVLPVTTG